jgi:3-methyl-2-oxobutanoate hydroxymethyltransferase
MGETEKGAAVTTAELLRMKAQGDRIVALTCYDALFARLLDASGVDILLVGDSVNQVLAAAPTTLSATLDQMIYHTRIVRRGAERALVVCDMPFLTYQVSAEEAVRNCGRVMQETGCHAVKLEGGQAMAETVRRLVEVGIPVMGHIGLTPQSVHALGGYRVQGRDDATA